MTDYDAHDEAAARLIHRSRAVSFLAGLADATSRAWRHSWTRRFWQSRVRPAPATPSAQWQWGASAALTASVVALALGPLSPAPAPLTWMFPAAVGVAALLIYAAGAGRRRE